MVHTTGHIPLIDTHCHIHDPEFSSKYQKTADELLAEAADAGVAQVICVGTDIKSSVHARDFVQSRAKCYFSLAIHPHEAASMDTEQIGVQLAALNAIAKESPDRLVAIGECGLDYYYHQDMRVIERQKMLFRGHIELALRYQLPMIFHIRDPKDQNPAVLGEAFADFFDILDEHEEIRGVVHSFSAGQKELVGCIKRRLLIGLNGIMTFTRSEQQLAAAKAVPLENLVLETDAPFLTPKPFRGTMCEPKHLRVTAEFLSVLRSESIDTLATATTKNARQLFEI